MLSSPESPDLLTAGKKTLINSPHQAAISDPTCTQSLRTDTLVPFLVLTARPPPAPPPRPPCGSAGCSRCFCTSRCAHCISPNALHTLWRSGSSGKQDFCGGEHHHSSARQSNSVKTGLLRRAKAEDGNSTAQPRVYCGDAALNAISFQARMHRSFLQLESPSCSIPGQEPQTRQFSLVALLSYFSAFPARFIGKIPLTTSQARAGAVAGHAMECSTITAGELLLRVP